MPGKLKIKLPSGFKSFPITNDNLLLLKEAWDLDENEFCTDAVVWEDVIEEEFSPPVKKPTMEHVMAWIEAGP